jgi:TolA-binding protein
MDRACEEYVKLSYRWPDDPLIAETIARLGQYFVRKGKELSAQVEETEDPLEAEKARMEATEHFVTAGKVFGRLAVRFPSHRLADKTTVVSAQCFLRAKDYEEAVSVFRKVIDNDKANKDLRAESMYWAADSYMRQAAEKEKDKNLLAAYRLFKDLTWDFPESQWAKYARGRLAGEDLAAFDTVSEEK